jgi:hypothetical protein
MNTKDIRTSTDPDMAGSYAAMERAARAAQDLAIKTNTRYCCCQLMAREH